MTDEPLTRGRCSASARCATARLRPVANRFAYPTYFLMLPMRTPARRAAAPALARNRFGADQLPRPDHGDGRADSLAWLDETARTRRHRRRDRRGLAALLSARARLRLQAGQLLVLPPRRRLAGGDRGRGQQHLRRAPLLPAARRRARLRPRDAASPRCSTSRPFAASPATTASASCAATCIQASRARISSRQGLWRGSTIMTRTASCSEPACRACSRRFRRDVSPALSASFPC